MDTDAYGAPEAALVFDGSAYASTVASLATPGGAAVRTMAGWVKCDWWSAGGAAIEFGSGGGRGTGARSAVFIYGGGLTMGFVGQYADSASDHPFICDSTWRLLAYTVGADGLVRLFVDGVIVKEDYLTLNTPSPSAIFLAWNGNPGHGNGEVFQGSLAGWKLWPAAMSPAQVAALYVAAPTTAPTPTVTPSTTPSMAIMNATVSVSVNAMTGDLDGVLAVHGDALSGLCSGGSSALRTWTTAPLLTWLECNETDVVAVYNASADTGTWLWYGSTVVGGVPATTTRADADRSHPTIITADPALAWGATLNVTALGVGTAGVTGVTLACHAQRWLR